MHDKGHSKRFSSGLLFLIIALPAFLTLQSFREESPRAAADTPPPIDILHYNINLILPDLASHSVIGITDIQVYTLRDSVRNIRLMLEHLLVDSIWINEERNKNIVRDGDLLNIRLEEPQERGTTILVTVFYHGKPVHDPRWGGFYFARDAAYNMGIGMTVIPHPYGRTWYPCVDNFTDKATYDYFITVPDTMVAACPGTLENIFHNHDGTSTWHWSLSDPIPTYLSSVAIAHYAILKDSLQGIRGLVPAWYFVPQGATARAKATFSHVPDYLRIFESLFGPYRWEKTGYATVPFPKGAMEHATCISVPEYVLSEKRNFDDLLSHEFSHNWFGNLVTCRSARDMWLNEGWAVYCEALYHEYSRGRTDYNRFIQHLHSRVLQYTHIADGGYYAVYGIPDDLTYGSTVYNKGADMVHTLRNFLGDKLFFSALKKYFQKYAYGNISTQEFESFLSTATHVDMKDFFNTWIYTPGFPHFSLDSFLIIRDRDDYITGLFLRQRLRGRKDYSYNTPVTVALVDSSWKLHKEKVIISGPLQKKTLITSFRPVAVLLNPELSVSDATSAAYRIIKQAGSYTFDNCFFRLDAGEGNDSAFFRVVHHWIGPEPSAHPAGLTLSENRYWSIEGVLPDSTGWQGSFDYNFSRSMKNGYLDTLAAPPVKERILLLYRPSLRSAWVEVPCKRKGNNTSGILITSFIRKGDYCVAVK